MARLLSLLYIIVLCEYPSLVNVQISTFTLSI